MKTPIARFALAATAAALSLSSIGCSADIHDNTADIHDNTANIDDAEVEMETDADTDNVQASQSLPLVIVAENVFLIDPASEPSADRIKVAGHFQIYFDSTSNEPLLITAEESIRVTIPSDAARGAHKVICRIHKHDGTPTQATFELSVKITG